MRSWIQPRDTHGLDLVDDCATNPENPHAYVEFTTCQAEDLFSVILSELFWAIHGTMSISGSVKLENTGGTGPAGGG